MALLDSIKDGLDRVLPQKRARAPVTTSMSGGLAGTHGFEPFEDDMIISKAAIIFHISQSFFNFLAMACYASVAAFQAKWGVGPSGLSGFALFVSVSGIILPLAMMAIPVVYEKYDKLSRLARALKEVRVSFILTGVGTTFSLLIAFIVTISAWTEAGCKNPNNDPHASLGSGFVNGLSSWCATKKAAAIFFWLAFGFWVASVGLLIMDWRAGNLTTRPRDPIFMRPASDLEEGEEDEAMGGSYQQVSNGASVPLRQSAYDNSNATDSPFADTNRLSNVSGVPPVPAPPSGYSSAAAAASRPSMDAYGAFSDPAPSGFGGVSPSYAPPESTTIGGEPRISRTMQYADPYAAVRASVVGGAPAPGAPPGYDSYQGYR